jgi:hypothetical protein
MTSLELFYKYIEHRVPVYDINSSGKIVNYCDDIDCDVCPIDRACRKLGKRSTLTLEDIKEVKITHPEFFV